jgi:hypothetical protein
MVQSGRGKIWTSRELLQVHNVPPMVLLAVTAMVAGVASSAFQVIEFVPCPDAIVPLVTAQT